MNDKDRFLVVGKYEIKDRIIFGNIFLRRQLK